VQFGRYLPAIRRNLLPPSVGYKILNLLPYVTPCSLADRYQTVEGTCCVASQCRRLRLFHTGTWRRVIWYRGTTVLEKTGGNRSLLRPRGRTVWQWDCCYSKDVNRHVRNTAANHKVSHSGWQYFLQSPPQESCSSPSPICRWFFHSYITRCCLCIIRSPMTGRVSDIPVTTTDTICARQR
jgi:hypothetical protein